MIRSFLSEMLDKFTAAVRTIFKQSTAIDIINQNITVATLYMPAMLDDLIKWTDPKHRGTLEVNARFPELKALTDEVNHVTRNMRHGGYGAAKVAVAHCAEYMQLLLGIIENEFDKTTREMPLDKMPYRLAHIVTEINAAAEWFYYIGHVSRFLRSAMVMNFDPEYQVAISKKEKAYIVAGIPLFIEMMTRYQTDPAQLIREIRSMEQVTVTSDVANYVSGKTIEISNRVGFTASKMNPLFLMGMIYNSIFLWHLDMLKSTHEQAQIQRNLLNRMISDKGLSESSKDPAEQAEFKKLKRQIEHYDNDIARLDRKIREKLEND